MKDFLIRYLRPARRFVVNKLDRKGLGKAKQRLRLIVKMKQELLPGMELRINELGQAFLHNENDGIDYFFPLGAEDPIKIGNYSGFEERERKLVTASLSEGSSMIDVGANVGVFSLTAARARENLRIFAIEPVRDNFEVCRVNLERNQLADRISAVQLALGEKSATVDIPTGVGTWQFISSAADKSHSEGMRLQKVEQVRLDDFVKENVKGPVSMIKCDVEGYELFVLKGAMETLQRHKPALLLEISKPFCARFRYEPQEIFRLLEPMGYVYIQLKGDGSTRFGTLSDPDVDFSGSNFFFVSREKAESFRALLAQN